MAVGFSLKTQSVISALSTCASLAITSASNLLPTPFPALSGETYKENKWPRLSSSASLPKLAKPNVSSSAATSVKRPGFGLADAFHTLVVVALSIDSRTSTLIKSRYEMFQQARNTVTSEPKSLLSTGRISMIESLAGL